MNSKRLQKQLVFVFYVVLLSLLLPVLLNSLLLCQCSCLNKILRNYVRRIRILNKTYFSGILWGWVKLQLPIIGVLGIGGGGSSGCRHLGHQEHGSYLWEKAMPPVDCGNVSALWVIPFLWRKIPQSPSLKHLGSWLPRMRFHEVALHGKYSDSHSFNCSWRVAFVKILFTH